MGQEAPLEKGIVAHSSILAWRIPWTGGLQPMGSLKVRHNLVTFTSVTTRCLCNPMNSSPPGSSIHGSPQARTLEWAATPSSRGSPQPRDRTRVCCVAGRFSTAEPPGKPRDRWVSARIPSALCPPRLRWSWAHALFLSLPCHQSWGTASSPPSRAVSGSGLETSAGPLLNSLPSP